MIDVLSSGRQLPHMGQGPKCQATEHHTLQRKASLCVKSHWLNLCLVAAILLLARTAGFKATGPFHLVWIRKSTKQLNTHS